jgi:hypothetical protein
MFGMFSSSRRQTESTNDLLSESDLIILESDAVHEPLTEREIRVARLAAELAVKKMQDNFYKGVGRTVVDRWLIIIGAAVVAFAGGKGWLSSLLTGGKL